jgi:hypothetical protein
MGTVEKHQNVLSFGLLDEIHEYIVQHSNDYIWRDNSMWNEDITAGSAEIGRAHV